VYLFATERKQWALASKGVSEVKPQHLEKAKWVAHVTLRFEELSHMHAFTAFAQDNGYTLTDSSHATVKKDNPFLDTGSSNRITLSRPVDMNEVALHEAMYFLSNAARQEKYHGKFIGLALSRAK
jgi:hypothetical protein